MKQSRRIELLERKINFLHEQVKQLSAENEKLHSLNKELNAQADACRVREKAADEARKTFEKGLIEIDEIKADYARACTLAKTVKRDYSKRFRKLFGNLKMNKIGGG